MGTSVERIEAALDEYVKAADIYYASKRKSMKISFFKIFAVLGIINNWLLKSMVDGKITVSEAIELVEQLCNMLGIDFDKEGIDVSG